MRVLEANYVASKETKEMLPYFSEALCSELSLQISKLVEHGVSRVYDDMQRDSPKEKINHGKTSMDLVHVYLSEKLVRQNLLEYRLKLYVIDEEEKRLLEWIKQNKGRLTREMERERRTKHLY